MRNTLFLTAALLLLLLSVVPAAAEEGPSERESNNSKDLADLVQDMVIEGEISEDDPDDWFVLDGQEGTRPTFTMRFDDEELEVDWEVLSGDEVVASMTDWDSPETVTVEVPGTCYIHVWWWDGEGEYTIEIETTECEGDSENEPNDEIDLADLIEDLEIEGYSCEGDDDWFVLDGQEGRRPTFTMRFDDDELEVDWEVLSGDEVVASMTDWDSPEHVTVDVPGTCYIHVWNWDGEGEYTIEIEP